MAQLGHYSIVLSFFVAVFCTVALFWGAHTRNRSLEQTGKRGVLVLFGLTSVGIFSLLVAILNNDFSIKYVEATSRISQPLIYKISAVWSAQEGSLLFWLWLATLFTAAVAYFWTREAGDLLPYALSVLSLVCAFFAIIVGFVANPFEQQFPAPPDGRGMTPLLQDPGMLAHPLFLYIGFVGMGVPFAFGIATLLTRRRGSDWLKITRRWTMVAWLFLTLGIVVGGWWAYQELGWGGYWGWDPVENSSLIPWLTATAFFHSAMVQERRGMLKNWNILLVIFSFVLTIFSTFLTRSGILSSVHSFAESPIGPWFMGFIGILLGGSLYLVFDRYEVLTDEGAIESPVSKEASFLLNNLILVAVTLTVLLGTTFPLLTKLAGQEVTIGGPYYNAIAGPLFGAMIILMGICPLLAWRRASVKQFPKLFLWPAIGAVAVAVIVIALGYSKPGAVFGFASSAFVLFTIGREFWQATRARSAMTGEKAFSGFSRLVNRNPRRYGGYLVHIGIILMAIGVTGSHFFQETKEVTGLQAGQSFTIAGRVVEFQGLRERFLEGDVTAVYAEMQVSKDGRPIGFVRPERRFYPGFEQMGPSTEAGILGSLKGDVYVLLAGWEASGAVATFRAFWNPLVAWIWIGLYFIMGGTLFAIWPRRRKKAAADEEQAVFRNLSELEYDFRMGKISAEDYQRLRTEISEDIAGAMSGQTGKGKSATAARKKGEGDPVQSQGKKRA